MQPRSRAPVVLFVLVAVVPSARAEDDDLRSSVVRFAEAQWGDCSREAVHGGVVRDGNDVELVSVRPRTQDAGCAAFTRDTFYATGR